MGLAGLGDLVLTSTDSQSRNRRFGLALAAGKRCERGAEGDRPGGRGLQRRARRCTGSRCARKSTCPSLRASIAFCTRREPAKDGGKGPDDALDPLRSLSSAPFSALANPDLAPGFRYTAIGGGIPRDSGFDCRRASAATTHFQAGIAAQHFGWQARAAQSRTAAHRRTQNCASTCRRALPVSIANQLPGSAARAAA